ncbi:DUF4388 domain-containing protein [Actinocorallia populi]|uniref:DUF4388 domain-containing protein n=1 Tax=Actinocorallia populi TaxID=2079200 RepID=UPI000D092CEC|nr:DUF4388 domain-containing protein [Actinocorallia populi]
MSAVIDELDALARDGASGALKVEGRQQGTVYLDGGRFVFAESTGVPDLASRLIGARRLSAERWNTLRTEGRPGEFGALLVARGVIDEEELADVLRSAFLDALTALAAGGETPETKFAPLQRPWISSALDLEMGFLRQEVVRRAGHEFPLDARPKLIDLNSPWGIVERGQWAVACRIDGVTTLRDLAWRNGFSLYETLENVQGLVRAGLCALPASGTPEPEAPVMELAAPVAEDEDSLLPRRRPGTTIWDRTPVETGLTNAALEGNSMFTIPDNDLLKRLIQELQQMN